MFEQMRSMRVRVVFLLALLSVALSAIAKAEGIENETAYLQGCIDNVAAQGGGRVTVKSGRHVTGGLILRSNVELHLEKGATLEGLGNIADYPIVDLPFSEGRWQAVVMAVGATNVAITGEGTIFGNGGKFQMPRPFGAGGSSLRPRGVFFGNCRDVKLLDFTLRDAGSWGCVLQCCNGVEVRRVVIDNHANLNNDGIDIEASNVVVSDCDIDSGDDGVCLKSNNPDFTVENVVVSNCTVRSFCVPFKIGTATHGTVRNVLVTHCRTEASRRDCLTQNGAKPLFSRNRSWEREMPGWKMGVPAALSAIAVECVDGGAVEDITFRNIRIDGGAMVPIFVRANRRLARNNGTPRGSANRLQRIRFENIVGRSVSGVPSSVSGISSFRVRDVLFRDVHLTGLGCGDIEVPPVPECESATPGARMFRQGLPAYGLWARHVDGLVLDNVDFSLADGMRDCRPAILKDDVGDGFVRIFNGFDLSGWTGATNLFYVENGELVFKEGEKNFGNLFYGRELKDFSARFQFKLVSNGNNGFAIRAGKDCLEGGALIGGYNVMGDAAYNGMEIQILDDTGPLKQKNKAWQYCGSIYGVVAAQRGHLRPVGEWNDYVVTAFGEEITVVLNGVTILATSVRNLSTDGRTPDGKPHPGLHNRSGYIGFLGHTMPVRFRNIEIKEY